MCVYATVELSANLVIKFINDNNSENIPNIHYIHVFIQYSSVYTSFKTLVANMTLFASFLSILIPLLSYT